MKPITNEQDDEPTFCWQLPQGPETNLLDIYFDIETNRWESFEFMYKDLISNVGKGDEEKPTQSAAVNAGRIGKKELIFTEFIPTIETT